MAQWRVKAPRALSMVQCSMNMRCNTIFWADAHLPWKFYGRESSLNCDSSQASFPKNFLEIDVIFKLSQYGWKIVTIITNSKEIKVHEVKEKHFKLHTNDYTWMKFLWAGRRPTLQCIGWHTKAHCALQTTKTHFAGSAIKSFSSTTSTWTPTSSFRALDVRWWKCNRWYIKFEELDTSITSFPY